MLVDQFPAFIFMLTDNKVKYWLLPKMKTPMLQAGWKVFLTSAILATFR